MSVTDPLSRLWEPIQVGPVRLRNRVFVSAHTTNLGRHNLATDRHVAYHRERARGGVGLIITEALRVHPTAAARDRTLGIFDDACIEPLARVTEAVHDEGAAIFGQVMHIGRQANGALARTASWGATAEPWTVGAPVPHAMGAVEIARLLDAFAAGTRRVVAAGFDGIEVHLGHGHLLAQFLSPAVNRRDDRYGGSPEARLRLPREALERVLTHADGRPVGIRVSADEFLPDGLTPAAVVDLIGQLTADLPIAFLDVSHSAYVGNHSLSTQMADMTFATGAFRHLPAAIKQAFPDVPVFAICRLDTLDVAADVLASGEADVVGLTRAHIADPHLIAKARAGDDRPAHRCIACNQACIGRIEHDLPMSCVVNPEVGFEREWSEWRSRSATPTPRRILIVGGGPAGLRAALAARDRGHDVTLREAREQLGGQIRYAAELAHRSRFRLLVDDLERAVRHAGVEVGTGTAVTPDEVRRGGYQAVVLATGSRATAPQGRTDVWTALDRPDELGDHVVVVDEDGTWAGAGTALHLAERGATVDLVTPVAGLAWNVSVYVRLSLAPLLGQAGVRVRPLRRLTGDLTSGVELADVLTGAREPLRDVSGIVHVGPRTADDGLAQELTAAGLTVDVIVAGDAYAPRTAFEAVYEGQLAGVLAGGETPPLLTDPDLPPYVAVSGTPFH
jgi:dimethylglycine catabolism A